MKLSATHKGKHIGGRQGEVVHTLFMGRHHDRRRLAHLLEMHLVGLRIALPGKEIDRLPIRRPLQRLVVVCSRLGLRKDMPVRQ